MAIAFDTNTNAGLAGESSKSFSHVVTGTSPVLFVHVGGDSSVSVTGSITYGGQNLLLGKQESASGGGRWTEVWYKIGPLTGSNTVAVTLSGTCTGAITASSWTGVSTLGTWVSNGTTGTTSIDVASAVGDTAVDFKQIASGASVTPGGSQTLVYDYDPFGAERLYSSKIPGGSPTVTMSWSDGGTYTNHAGVSMTPGDQDTTDLKGVGMAG